MEKRRAIHYFIRALILFSFSYYIVHLVRMDAMTYYIAPRMEIYVKLSALGLYAISVYQIFLAVKVLRGRIQDCDCQHIPSRSVLKNTIIYGLFVFPLALGFIVPDNVLGSTLAAKKGINYSSADRIRPTEPVKIDINTTLKDDNPALVITDNSTKDNETESLSEVDESGEDLDALFESDVWSEFYADFAKQIYLEPIIRVEEDIYIETLTTLDLFLDPLAGKTLEITGFVYREETMSDDQFVVARFAMDCCAADAAPYGVLVQFDDAASLADDEWITVTGTISKTTFNDFEILLLEAEQAVQVNEPDEPYVYPNYEFGFE